MIGGMSHNITVVFLIISWLVYILFIYHLYLSSFLMMKCPIGIWYGWYGPMEDVNTPPRCRTFCRVPRRKRPKWSESSCPASETWRRRRAWKTPPRNHGLGREFTLTCIIISHVNHVIALFGTIYGMFDIRGMGLITINIWILRWSVIDNRVWVRFHWTGHPSWCFDGWACEVFWSLEFRKSPGFRKPLL